MGNRSKTPATVLDARKTNAITAIAEGITTVARGAGILWMTVGEGMAVMGRAVGRAIARPGHPAKTSTRPNLSTE